jgi:multimeric flavodoxin WrbA
MSLKVLGISTSPRREGNSDLLLRQALSGAREAGSVVEYLRLCDYRIQGCRECYNCSATGVCSTKDDYQPILDKMLEADRVILATPVFFMTVSAQAKLLIDRGQCLWVRHRASPTLFERNGIDGASSSPSAAPAAASSSIAFGSRSNPASSTSKWITWAACVSIRWMKKGRS